MTRAILLPSCSSPQIRGSWPARLRHLCSWSHMHTSFSYAWSHMILTYSVFTWEYFKQWLILWPLNSPWYEQIPSPNAAQVCVRLFWSHIISLYTTMSFKVWKGDLWKRRREIINQQRESEWLIPAFKSKESEVLPQSSGSERGNAFNCNNRDLFWIR